MSAKFEISKSKSYERKTSAKNEPYSNLKTSNAQVIGHSEM